MTSYPVWLYNVEWVGMDVSVKFGGSVSNFGLYAGRTVLCTFVQYIIAFCGRLEAGSDVLTARFIRLTVADRCIKFRNLAYTVLDKFDPKPSDAGIFGRFYNFDTCGTEVADDVISCVALDYIGMDGRAKCGDSRLNSGRIIRLFIQPARFYGLFCNI